MSKLSRAIKYIFLIWILSISFAVPQAIQTGIVQDRDRSWCTVLEGRVLIEHSFELATVLFFFAPMTLITVLYVLIGVKLRSSTMIKRENGSTVQRNNTLTSNIHHTTNQSTKRVLKMLGKAIIINLLFFYFNFYSNNDLINSNSSIIKVEPFFLNLTRESLLKTPYSGNIHQVPKPLLNKALIELLTLIKKG